MGDWHPRDAGAAPVRRGTQSASFAMRLSVLLLATAGPQHVDSTADWTLSPAPGPRALVNGNSLNRSALLDWWRTSQAVNVQALSFSKFSDEGSPWISHFCPDEPRYAQGTVVFAISDTMHGFVVRNVSMSACVESSQPETNNFLQGGQRITAMELVAPEPLLLFQGESKA